MASRLYFTSNPFSGPTYPADANWNDTSQCTTQSSDMGSLPSGDAFFSQTAQKNSAANPHAILHIRYKFPLPAGLLLQGNIRGQHFGQCPGTLGGMRAVSVRVFDSGTTLRANLVQDFAGALTSGFTGTLTNRNMPPSLPIATPYTTVAGDVLVVEIGSKWFTAAQGGTVTAAIRFGDAGVTDLPVDETTGVGTPEQNGWIEFESVDLFGKHDDWLMTTSGPLTSRLASPSKRGVHHFDTDNFIETIFAGVPGWKRIALISPGGVAVGTEIQLANTTDIDVTLTGSTFTWNAQALSAESDRAKNIVLTNDATNGALFTASNTWSANAITFFPPNRVGTALVAFGKYGNASFGTALDDFIGLRAIRSDTSATTTVQGFNTSAINNDIGASGLAARGGIQNATASATNLGAPSSTISVVGGAAQATGGAGTTDNFQGTIFGFQATVNAFSASVANPILAMYALQTGGLLTRANAATFAGLRCTMPTLVINGSISALYGVLVESQTAGSTRVGLQVQGAATGTPTLTAGLQVGTHNVGTKRRAVIGGNSYESQGGDFIADQNPRGLVVEDAQAAPRFWRYFNNSTVNPTTGDAYMEINQFGIAAFSRLAGAVGTVQTTMQDLGSNAPAT
jgi:hypothetical protein